MAANIAPLENCLAITNDPFISYILYQKPQMEARQSSFTHPSCLEAHATPTHESGDRAPCNPPSTRQHPLTTATAPGSPAVPRSEYTHTHETKEEKRRRVPIYTRKTKNRWKRPACNEWRRFRGGSSERPGAYQPSTLRERDLNEKFLCLYGTLNGCQKQ